MFCGECDLTTVLLTANHSRTESLRPWWSVKAAAAENCPLKGEVVYNEGLKRLHVIKAGKSLCPPKEGL